MPQDLDPSLIRLLPLKDAMFPSLLAHVLCDNPLRHALAHCPQDNLLPVTYFEAPSCSLHYTPLKAFLSDHPSVCFPPVNYYHLVLQSISISKSFDKKLLSSTVSIKKQDFIHPLKNKNPPKRCLHTISRDFSYILLLL